MIRRLLDDRVYLSDLRFQYESIIHTLNDEAVNCKYILNSGFQLGVGQTSIAKTPSDFISVDIGYVNKTLSVLDFGKTVSNFDYVNGLVSIFHERQHVYQQQQDFTGLSCRDDALMTSGRVSAQYGVYHTNTAYVVDSAMKEVGLCHSDCAETDGFDLLEYSQLDDAPEKEHEYPSMLDGLTDEEFEKMLLSTNDGIGDTEKL